MLDKNPKKTLTVIGFDSWTGGAHHFRRLLPSFRKQGIEFVLIHIGSWGVDKGRAKEEMLEDLPIRDISFYGGFSFQEILEKENPSAVVFLSTQTFAHRAFNRLCKMKNIPTVHVYHGLMSALAVSSAKPYQRNFVSYFWFVVSRLFKMATKTWPCYIRALIVTGASLKEWSRFFMDNVDLLVGKNRLEAAVDEKTDLCCIYADGDRKHAITQCGHVDEEVVSVGNPDLPMFGLMESLIGSNVRKDISLNNDVMYIDTALLHRGATFSNGMEFIVHLALTHETVTKAGKRLIVKLHPEHFRTNLPEQLKSMGIVLCDNSDFVSRLESTCVCIVEPSSAAVIPALMGVPLLLARYDKLKGQSFGEMLVEYPAGNYLDDINEFKMFIKRGRDDGDALAFERWKDKYCGPLPAENMADRTVDSINELIRNRQQILSNHG